MTNSEIRYHIASVERSMKLRGTRGTPYAQTGSLIVALAEAFYNELHRPKDFASFHKRIHGFDLEALDAIHDLWNGGKITITGYSEEELIGDERAGLLLGARAWRHGQKEEDQG